MAHPLAPPRRGHRRPSLAGPPPGAEVLALDAPPAFACTRRMAATANGHVVSCSGPPERRMTIVMIGTQDEWNSSPTSTPSAT
jgi:hypothetical protein